MSTRKTKKNEKAEVELNAATEELLRVNQQLAEARKAANKYRHDRDAFWAEARNAGDALLGIRATLARLRARVESQKAGTQDRAQLAFIADVLAAVAEMERETKPTAPKSECDHRDCWGACQGVPLKRGTP